MTDFVEKEKSGHWPLSSNLLNLKGNPTSKTPHHTVHHQVYDTVGVGLLKGSLKRVLAVMLEPVEPELGYFPGYDIRDTLNLLWSVWYRVAVARNEGTTCNFLSQPL